MSAATPTLDLPAPSGARSALLRLGGYIARHPVYYGVWLMVVLAYVAGFVALPLLGAALPASVFRAVAPAVVLWVYAYLHLYVGELLRRLRSFDPDLNPTL